MFALTLRSMKATPRSAASRSTVRRLSRSNTFTFRDGSPALPSQMYGASVVAGLKVGEVVVCASLLVIGMPYHSSKP